MQLPGPCRDGELQLSARSVHCGRFAPVHHDAHTRNAAESSSSPCPSIDTSPRGVDFSSTFEHRANLGVCTGNCVVLIITRINPDLTLALNWPRMAVPALLSFPDTVDWSKTVEPYIPQLYDLPSKLQDVLQSRQNIVDLYMQTNPLISGLGISILLGAVFLVVAEVNKNYSQVDRCWSILPTFYIVHFDLWARLSGISSQRIDAILLFSTLWSVGCFPCSTLSGQRC